MIEKFVKVWDAKKDKLRDEFKKKHPESYDGIFKSLCQMLHEEDEYNTPDPARIHVIDDGDYQGTRLFIVAGGGYQPSEYWSCKIGYGSCSGCDTFQGIRDGSSWGDEVPTDDQAGEYLTLAMHMLQSIKEV